MPARVAAGVLVALMLAAGGCGGPRLKPVTGRVTVKGQPVAKMLVYFWPATGELENDRIAAGETDKDGQFTLHSPVGPGISPGEYKVTFSRPITKKGKKPVGGDKVEDDQVIETVPPPFDEKTSHDDSPVRFTVKPGANVFDHDFSVDLKK